MFDFHFSLYIKSHQILDLAQLVRESEKLGNRFFL